MAADKRGLQLVRPSASGSHGVDGHGGGGNDGGMDARLAKLEAVIPTLSTKEDLVREVGSVRTEIHKEINAQTWRLVTFVTGFGTALVAATYFVAKYVH